jgi:parallel beta-helix repeat protein
MGYKVMKLRKSFVYFCSGLAAVVAMLAVSAPTAAQAAAVTVVVDNNTTADNCGSYDGSPAETNPVTAINTAGSGLTIVVCPGTYTLTAPLQIGGKKLTIKRALSDVGLSPTFVSGASMGLMIEISGGSSVTIDGLVLDGRTSTLSSYHAIDVLQSGLTLNNTTLLGPNLINSSGVYVNNSSVPKALPVNISNTSINGYQGFGVYAFGGVKLTVKSSFLDAGDGGRVSGGVPTGIWFDAVSPSTVPVTGSVSKTTIVNSYYGIALYEASKVSISGNTLIDNFYGVYLLSVGANQNSDGNKITGNVIVGVPSSGVGIYISNQNPGTFSTRSLIISKNMLYTQQYTSYGASPSGIYIQALSPAQTTVTGTITGNTLWGFPATPNPLAIVNENGNAGVKISKNYVMP